MKDERAHDEMDGGEALAPVTPAEVGFDTSAMGYEPAEPSAEGDRTNAPEQPEVADQVNKVEAVDQANDEARERTDLEERADRLARRVAELEARRAEDPDAATADLAATLDDRVEALEIQLASAREREDALTAETVHANTILAEVGGRLADLGEAADRSAVLESELAEAQQAHAEATAAHAALTQAHETLTSDHAEATDSLRETGERLAAAGAAQESADTRLHDLEETLTETTLERDGARSELMRLMEEEQELATKVAAAEMELGRVRAEYDAAQEQAHADTEARAEELQEVRAALEEATASATERVAGFEVELEAARSLIEAKDAELAELAVAKEELEAARETLVGERETLASERAQATEELETRRAAYEEATQAREALQAELEVAAGSVADLEASLRDAEAATAAAESELAAATEAASSRESALRTELDEARSQTQTASASLDAVRLEADAAAAQLAELGPELASLQQAHADLQSRQVTVQTDAAASSERLPALESAVAETEARASQAEAQLADLRRWSDGSAERITEMQAELLEARSNHDATRSELEAARAELASVRTELESTRAEIDRVPAEGGASEELRSALAAAESRAAGAEARASGLEAELGAASVNLANLGMVHESVLGRVEESKQAAAELQAQLDARGDDSGETTEALQQELARTKEALLGAHARVAELEGAAAEAPTSETQHAPTAAAEGEDADLRAVIADLENSLEQTEVRARRAYAAAESAEAALRFAKERGEVIATDPAMEQEVARLRAQVPELMSKLAEADAAKRRAEADAHALRAGIDPDALKDPMGDEPPAVTSEIPPEAAASEVTDASTTEEPRPADEQPSGKSLRGRLADAALSRKGRPTDSPEWR